MRWRFIDTGFNAGDYNMALDTAMTRGGSCQIPTLRFFRWKPYCISLGFHQNVAEFDTSKCLAEGIDIARRPTAGRAILHVDELTYSVIIPASHPLYKILPLDFYRLISETLVDSLQSLGAKVEFARGEKLYRNGRPLRISCFASSARNEIVYNGKKIVGSAQRRFREGTLQQGSILLSDDHKRLFHFLKYENKVIASEKQSLAERTTTLKDVCQRPVGYEELAKAIYQGFCKKLEISFEDKAVTKDEMELTKSLIPQYRTMNTREYNNEILESPK